MTHDQTVVQIGRRRPARESKRVQNTVPSAPSPVSPTPVVLEEGRQAIRIGLLVVVVAFGGGGLLLGRAPLASAVVASGMVKVADNGRVPDD